MIPNRMKWIAPTRTFYQVLFLRYSTTGALLKSPRCGKVMLDDSSVVCSGNWEFIQKELLIFTHNSIEHREKVAAFDLDGTIITTKTGHTFPTKPSDWKMLHNEVIPKLQSLHGDGYKVVFFTNQKGIKLGLVDKEGFKRKIENIVTRVGVPIQVFAAVDSGIYRKPNVGMWHHFRNERNGEIEVDMYSSFFVGDAAGRNKSKTHSKKDHSSADKYFAENAGLRFLTPEEFF